MFLKLCNSEIKAIVEQIGVGKYVFVYEGPGSWAIHRADSKPHRSDTAYSMFIIDTKYHAPGYEYRREVYYEDERASGPVCSTHGVLAVLDTEEEANALAERLSLAYKAYQEEMKAPLLKLELAIKIALTQ